MQRLSPASLPSRVMKKTTLAHLGLLGANLFYGAGFSVAKMVMPEYIKPGAFILIRIGITMLLFWLTFYMLRKKWGEIKLQKKWIPILLLGAATGITANQLLFFKGLSLTEPIHASLIMLTTPLLVSVFSAFYLKNRLSAINYFGVILGVGGAAILLSTRQYQSHLASNIFLGNIFVFLNAICYAIYLVIIKPLMQSYPALFIITLLFSVGFVFALPFGTGDFMQVDWDSFGASQWYAVLFIVLAVTYATYLWNAYAIKILNPVIAGAYIYTQPIFAAIISILFFSEEITFTKAVAAVLIFVGVFLVGRKK